MSAKKQNDEERNGFKAIERKGLFWSLSGLAIAGTVWYRATSDEGPFDLHNFFAYVFGLVSAFFTIEAIFLLYSRVLKRVPALQYFRFFCRGATRDQVDLIAADLKKDVREMRRKGFSKHAVLAVVIWRILGCIVPIAWDGILRCFSAILPATRIIKALKTWF